MTSSQILEAVNLAAASEREGLLNRLMAEYDEPDAGLVRSLAEEMIAVLATEIVVDD
jgi:hypothetical protein